MADEPTPFDDAERIRLKRLAKLTSPSAPASPSPPPAQAGPSSVQTPPKPQTTLFKHNPPPSSSLKRPTESPPISLTPLKKRAPQPSARLSLPDWEHETLRDVLLVTLDRAVAENSEHRIVWLKSLADELEGESSTLSRPLALRFEHLDRLLITRLELNPQSMSDDLDYLPVLASLPSQQTTFQFLVGCWKRYNAARTKLRKRGYAPAEMQKPLASLDKLRDLLVSYCGMTLQWPDMFPQPTGVIVGPSELVQPLLGLSSFSSPLLSNATSAALLEPTEVEPFLQDLAIRFSTPDELTDVLAPVVRQLLFNPALWRPDVLTGGDSTWRGVVAGMEALVSVKSIATMITQMPEWNPVSTTAVAFERMSLLGPLCRLGVFQREWPLIAQTYFSKLDTTSRAEIDSTNASLRGTLRSLQKSLFSIFNAIVRSSPEAREAVLQYFARVISLNVKRGGMQVDFNTVASDGFMINLLAVLLDFATPFMDSKFSKIDRIDPSYLLRSSRIEVKEETRINATTEDVNKISREILPAGDTAPPNFITEIFYLTVAMSHYGLQRTAQSFDDLGKSTEDLQRYLDNVNSDTSWQGSPMQARVEANINNVKSEIAKVHAQQFAYQVQLMDPDFIYRNIGFTNFLSTWLIRLVDQKHTHPDPMVTLPLPQEVPGVFRILPEYFFEDIVESFLFTVRHSPDKLDLSGKNELLVFALTFLTSTWYIKNPFLKAKINESIFYGTLPYGREKNGVLGNLLNTHPVALKHLMSAMMSFYIEVEQTGASSQFYDKFNARRNIAYIFKAIWTNPDHREALDREAKNVDKFVRFINLMINDVTYLMDESLSELTQIHNIQMEMKDQEAWARKSAEYRREREQSLRQLERHASGYTTLGRSTVELLKVFTAQTKKPFMEPEIVDRLAAMLNYNLEALVGPKCRDLKVADPEKYRFNPRQLLQDILSVYQNLSDQEEFVLGVAKDGRSYKKALFERAAGIKALKTDAEIELLRHFVVKVEEAKTQLEADEDLGDIPDEFLDPLMFSIMRDPVILPSSKTTIDRATIKSHLLSDPKDPFNRAPLKIEDVIPDTELKAQIEAFILERRAERSAPLTVAVPEMPEIPENVPSSDNMQVDEPTEQ